MTSAAAGCKLVVLDCKGARVRVVGIVLGLAFGLGSMSMPANAGSSRGAQVAAAGSSALVLKCRKAVFRKYGRRAPDATGKKMLYLNMNFAVRQVDICVANGGRVS